MISGLTKCVIITLILHLEKSLGRCGDRDCWGIYSLRKGPIMQREEYCAGCGDRSVIRFVGNYFRTRV